MRLPEPIETRGFFWLPGQPENEVPGLLRISESGEIELEALGLFRDFRAVMEDRGIVVESPVKYEKPNLDRIVGIVDKGRSVTLDGCIPRHEQFGTGPSNPIIHANFAFIGKQYDAGEEVEFSELWFSVDGLDEWLAVSGFHRLTLKQKESEHQRVDGFSVYYDRPGDISLNLPDGCELAFKFDCGFVLGRPPTTKVEVAQKAYISLSLTEPQSVEYFFSLMSKICNFLAFAVDRNVSIDSITGYSEHETGNAGGRQEPVEIYGRIGHHSEKKPETQLYRMLFTRKHIHDHLEQVLVRWLESYERFEPAFNLYFASRSGGIRYLDVRFLMLAQGAEVLHRRIHQGVVVMPEAEFSSLETKVLEAVPDDRRGWMKRKLEYANEVSLRKRIKQMVTPFKDLMGTRRERNRFINKVVDTRNYLTHYDRDSAGKAASGQELWHLYQKLEALFQMHLMLLIGVPTDSIGSIVKANEELRNKLGLRRGDSHLGTAAEIELPPHLPSPEA